jgi:purine-binding chemotaxis protein CheW
MTAQEAPEVRQYLSFKLASSHCAVGILQIKEILQYEAITRIPSVPACIRGVINLRGAVVPVLDLAVKFGLPETEVTKRTCILIAEAALGGERGVVGMMADAVQEVLELTAADVEPPPSFGTQVRVDYLIGLGKAPNGFVLLLDLDRVILASEQDLAAQLSATALSENAEGPPAPGGEGGGGADPGGALSVPA